MIEAYAWVRNAKLLGRVPDRKPRKAIVTRERITFPDDSVIEIDHPGKGGRDLAFFEFKGEDYQVLGCIPGMVPTWIRRYWPK